MQKDFLLSSYDYELPKELIAQRPCVNRDQSRLLVYHKSSGEIIHDVFSNLSSYLPGESCLVFNESKVFPCRLLGQKESGGKIEIFLTEISQINRHTALIKSNSKKKVGDKYFINDEFFELVEISEENEFILSFSGKDLNKFLQDFGKVPIPPYIRGGDSDESDRHDYQTIYAKNIGSVAAPTAGLHFTGDVFESLEKKNIKKAFVNLHVGLGTFRPVVVDDIREHRIHSEYFFVEENQLELCQASKKVFAVGTTSLRVLESLRSGYSNYGKTDIFLYPGKEVLSIDGLITNFHLPKSSLLMLVSSIIGRDETLRVYNEAVKQKYRFFSYGDAMLIL